MSRKPRGLEPEYGAQFRDESVVQAYAFRPPYPAETFRILCELVTDSPATVLDLGCGGGELSIPLAAHVDRIDAVDPSAAMLRLARTRPGGESPKINWFCAMGENFASTTRYALVVAASSFHWMDWDIVIPKLRPLLVPRGYLALVEGPYFSPLPWDAALSELIARYSTNTAFEPYVLVDELTAHGLWRLEGRRRARPVPFEQPVDEHVELMHSRNGFSRDRMSADRAMQFDRAYRDLLSQHCPDGVVRTEVHAYVSWGLLT